MSPLDAATILAIAFGLAMDAFSVSIAYGITTKSESKNNALKMASPLEPSKPSCQFWDGSWALKSLSL